MTPSFAIHVHVYYRELWTELAQAIRSFSAYKHDLFVTTPHEDDEFRRVVLSDFPLANYLITENRGYDVGPFLEVLNRLNLNNYDFLVKLHTKRDFNGIVNLRYLRGGEWRKRLLAFCATPENLRHTLHAFESDTTIGMISHGSLITERGDFLEDFSVSKQAYELLASINLKANQKQFVAGNCFIARANLFKSLIGNHSIKDFEPFADHKASLAHVFERAFGYLVSAQGKTIRGIPSSIPWRDWLIAPFLPLHRILRNHTQANSRIEIVSVVRDRFLYEKLIINNPFLASATKNCIDNSVENLPISKRYNDFLDSYDYSSPAWLIFAHEDFEIREPLESKLSKLSPECLYGPIGCKRRGFWGLGYQIYLGYIDECDRDGSNADRSHGSPKSRNLARVDTFDCCALIVHSSLIQKHRLRFDENLLFDLYVEDFCATAKIKYGIKSRILRFKAVHHSGSRPTERLYRHLPYLKKKYPKVCFCGTCTYFGTMPLLMRLQRKLQGLPV